MRTILVTGGARGIGASIVAELSGSARVFATTRRPDEAAAIPGVEWVRLDLDDLDSCRSAVDTVVAAAGGVDVVVNNAATHVMGPFEEVGPAGAMRTLLTNVVAPMEVVRAALPTMRARERGHVVNVTSICDVLPTPFSGWYSASKAALANATTALGAELAVFGIRTTVVSPGLHRTEMAQALGHHPVAPESPYAPVLGPFVHREREMFAGAADPGQVASAVRRCIEADDPPARVVVGDDAVRMQQLVDDIDADAYAELMRGFMARLGTDEAT